MKPKYLVTLMLVATAAIDSVAILYMRRGVASADEVAEGLMAAQVSLLALWLALGRTYWPLRVGTLICGILSWAAIYPRNDTHEVATTVAVFAMGVLFLACIGRIKGIVWTRTQTSPTLTASTTRQPPQFSLRRLLAWMTVIAVVAALSRYGRLDLGSDELIGLSLMVLLAIASAWFASAHGNIVLRVAGTVGAAWFASYLLSWANNIQYSVQITLVLAIQAFFNFTWIALLKTVGISIHRVKRATTNEKPVHIIEKQEASNDNPDNSLANGQL